MTYQEEMYAHLVHEGDPQVLLDAFMKDLNEAQKKADEQLEKEKKEAEAAAQAEKALRKKREAVVAALTSYISHLLGEDISEDIVREGVMGIEESIDILKNIKVSVNGSGLKSLFDACM